MISYTVLILVILALTLRDLIIAIIALIPALTLLLDLVLLARSSRVECTLSHGGEYRVFLGDSVSFEASPSCRDVVYVESRGPVRVTLDHSINGFKMEIRGLHLGFYEVSSLKARRRSPMGLLEVDDAIRVNVRVKVIPRVVYLLVLAHRLLSGSGIEPGLSELESVIRSESGVYAYTREYTPGDSLRRIDWKATARLGELMVKEFKLESTGLGLIALDLRCPGEYTCDEIASATLITAMAGYSLGGEVTLLELDTGRISRFDGRELLAHAIRRVLEPEIAGRLDLYNYIPPLTLRELKRIAGRLGYRGLNTGDYKLGDFRGSNIVISTLLVGGDKVLELTDRSRIAGVETIVITARRPWIDMDNIEDAYIAYKTYKNIVYKLGDMGAKVYSCCPLSVVDTRARVEMQ